MATTRILLKSGVDGYNTGVIPGVENADYTALTWQDGDGGSEPGGSFQFLIESRLALLIWNTDDTNSATVVFDCNDRTVGGLTFEPSTGAGNDTITVAAGTIACIKSFPATLLSTTAEASEGATQVTGQSGYCRFAVLLDGSPSASVKVALLKL
jgi:hypothetical protein